MPSLSPTNPIALIHQSTTGFLSSLQELHDQKDSSSFFKCQRSFHAHIDTPQSAIESLSSHLAHLVWKKLENPHLYAKSASSFDTDLVSNDGFVESLFVEWDEVENDDEVERLANVGDASGTSSILSESASGTAKKEHTTTDDDDLHFRDVENRPELTAQYILVLSALNFCFWPAVERTGEVDEDTPQLTQVLDYPDLARSLKSIAEKRPQSFSALNLSRLTADDLCEWLGSSNIPLLHERVRLLNEVGIILERYFDGEASILIEKARRSACALVSLITSYFPGFRDHCISPVDGRQVFFYKRAQIFVADVWGAFSGKGLGDFYDINQITMFADYQVPQVLRHLGLMVYDEHLSGLVDNNIVIPAGSVEELEIRACTIRVVEDIRKILEQKHRIRCKSIEIDWYLWQQGESLKRRSSTLKPHHRTFTIYY
mmetsp:Transcript_6800/g.25384  ORF Transcript_6800/g.25384 Transcript_6800/m.25384 type:complete len:430 (+) Transcript_6800:4693-5982(+)